MGGRVTVVVGGQFGSEGKGAVAAWIGRQSKEPVVGVRVAGPNAGHTAIGSDGETYRLRQIPVVAVVDHTAALVIAAGSEIDLEVLDGEIDMLDAAGFKVSERLIIDGEATIVTDEHKEAEAKAELNKRLGSTSKGIGAARADRIWRTATRMKDFDGAVTDTQMLLAQWLEEGNHVIVEGTQGYGLGLHAGFYPFCTSGDCTAMDVLAQAGIAPWQPRVEHFGVVVVARVRPIRVAGNSGPMAGETSWADVGLPEEYTTVTKRVRRLGAWDPELVRRAVIANGGGTGGYRQAVSVALTMVDHEFPEIKGLESIMRVGGLPEEVAVWVADRQAEIGQPISLVGTGPSTMVQRVGLRYV